MIGKRITHTHDPLSLLALVPDPAFNPHVTIKHSIDKRGKSFTSARKSFGLPVSKRQDAGISEWRVYVSTEINPARYLSDQFISFADVVDTSVLLCAIAGIVNLPNFVTSIGSPDILLASVIVLMLVWLSVGDCSRYLHNYCNFLVQCLQTREQGSRHRDRRFDTLVSLLTLFSCIRAIELWNEHCCVSIFLPALADSV